MTPCLHDMARGLPLAPLDDPEGAAVPPAADTGGEVIDAHVHLFPDRVFEALWRWFDRHAWRVRYRLRAEEVVAFLRARGVAGIVALLYSHAPGMARELNRFAAEIARAHAGFVHACGTVLPGEPDAGEIAREALGPLGLHGLKIHCHVQKIAADDPRLEPIYEACRAARKPVVIHAGREPRSPAYGIDTHAICDAGRVGRVLERFPGLTMVVPHLGSDEFVEYAALLDRHEGLYLDTTMSVAGFFPVAPPPDLVARNAGRILYGTDFPNLPYAWDRELRRLVADAGLDAAGRRALFSGNARRVFGI
ncbi:MAG TPA: amidohydrolase family protein [Planctomycetota bacterium]|nr:amidohydrolase family protein [Planctomycetota bacterium]